MQSYTSDCFDASHTAQTDLANMENNFNSLRSNFSGNSQPSNPVAGMAWMDTTSGKFKIRNSGNSAWSTMMDIDNERVFKLNRTITAGTGLSGGGTLTSNLTLAHAAHTGDVTGTAALSIANHVIGPTNFIAGASPVYSQIAQVSLTNASWTDKETFIVYVTSEGGFMRLHGHAYRVGPNAGKYFRLRVGGSYSSGTGDINGSLTTAYTTSIFNAGSVNLSTFTKGTYIGAIQLNVSGAGNSIYVKNGCVVYGTST